MDAFSPQYGGVFRRIFECADSVSPRAGGVHNRASLDLNGASVDTVVNPRTGYDCPFEQQLGHGGVIQYRGAGVRRVNDVGECQTRIVRGGVPIRRTAEQTRTRNHRFNGDNSIAAEAFVPADISKQRQQIVQPEPGAKFPSGNPRSFVDRPCEPQGMHEFRCDAQQRPALTTGLEHQMQIGMLQVSHAAVNQPRRSAGSTAGEIVTFHECDRQATKGGVAGNPGTVDTTADHQQIKWSASEPVQRRGAPRDSRRH